MIINIIFKIGEKMYNSQQQQKKWKDVLQGKLLFYGVFLGPLAAEQILFYTLLQL